MCNDLEALLAEKLNEQFPGQVKRPLTPQEPCDWSKSYKTELFGRAPLYIKGAHREADQKPPSLPRYITCARLTFPAS